MSNTFETFDVREAPLYGVQLVEASAGTGKTWNIEGLFIRLMIERLLEPGQILVVTFTDAATQELRERILQRINVVARVIENPEMDVNGDPFLQFCREKYGGNPAILNHLDHCKSRFDEASIFTIHSFCKNILTDYRFEAGLGSEINILNDSSVLLREVLSDHWRRLNKRLSSSGNELFSSLLLGELRYQNLASAFKKLLVNPEIELSSVDSIVPDHWVGLTSVEREQDLKVRWSDLRRMWDDDRDFIRDQLQNAGISGKGFEKYWDKYEQAVTAFLDEPFLNLDIKHSEVLEIDYLNRKGQTAAASKAGLPFPDHRMYVLYQEFRAGIHWYRRSAMRMSLEELRSDYQRRRRQDQILIYDDLLTYVRDALNPQRNTSAAGVLRNRIRLQYPVAMIDEFQDTDAVQYEIFRRIYVEEPTSELLLYMIGDPKQSIYKFRGADLNTYYRARDHVSNRYTLKTNFRSAGDLVQAVNVLFRHEGSFLDDSLRYFDAVGNQPENAFWYEDEDAAALRFIRIGDDVLTKGSSGTTLVRWVVDQISVLLDASERGKAGIRKKNVDGTYSNDKITPGDIAILVSKKSQARLMNSMLNYAGIPGVESGDTSVFMSEEADQLILLLECLIDPRNLRKIRALLTSQMVGYSANDVRQMEQDDVLWSSIHDDLRKAGELMDLQGVLSGIRYIFDRWEVEQSIVARENGERGITNVRHLGELLYAEQQATHRSASGLVHWLKRNRDEEQKSDDARKIRLESDDDRVKIITMHSSKGLEYPIVFAPYLWDFNASQRDKWNIFSNGDGENRHLVMDYDNEVYADGSLRSRLEDWQDRIRLMYVALTRAKYRCYVPFMGHKSNSGSPLCGALVSRYMKGDWSTHWGDRLNWLADGTEMATRIDDSGSLNKDNVMLELVPRLADDSGRLISCASVSLHEIPRSWNSYRQLKLDGELFEAKISESGTRHLKKNRDISSYSSIQRKYAGDEIVHAFPDETSISTDVEGSSLTDSFSEIFEFPKGAVTGNLWHEVFELINFTDSSNWDDIITGCCIKHGFDPLPTKPILREMVKQVLGADLSKAITDKWGAQHPPEIRLGSIHWNDTRRELEFLSTFDPGDINRLILNLEQSGSEGEINIFGNTNKEGSDSFMVGLIDLVFVVDGKFYIADYKSNYLGSNIHSYDAISLEQDIRRNKYNLQYHIYTAALLKYLSKQIYDFDYDKHFGGVFYLYLRGIRSGRLTGIYFDRPDLQSIKELTGRIENNGKVGSDTLGGRHG